MIANIKCKYAKRMQMYDFPFYHNSNIFQIDITIYEIFAVEICMIFTFRVGQEQK